MLKLLGFNLKNTSKILPSHYTLYKLGKSYKLIIFKRPVRPGGFEKEEEFRHEEIEEIKKELRGQKSFNRLYESISRTKRNVKELALCNEFDYFITLTLNKDKQDRYNLEEYSKQLSQWIRNLRNRSYQSDIQYLLIPEEHKDGAWHIHGLIKGIPREQLKLFTVDDDIPQRMKALIKNGRILYNWLDYFDRFGFNSLEVIEDERKISSYITKYIGKCITTEREGQKKLYYSSRNLKRRELIKQGSIKIYDQTPDKFDRIPFESLNPYDTESCLIYDLNEKQLTEIIHSL